LSLLPQLSKGKTMAKKIEFKKDNLISKNFLLTKEQEIAIKKIKRKSKVSESKIVRTIIDKYLSEFPA